MAVQHVFSNAIPDFTGTVTGFNSQGSTTTLQATQLVRPSDWNSFHNQLYTLTGNTSNSSVVSGTNVVLEGGTNITLVGTGSTIRIVGAGGGVAMHSRFDPNPELLQVVGQQGQGTLHFQPMQAPPFQFDRIYMPLLLTNSTNSTGSLTASFWIGLYTRTASSVSLLMSTSATLALTWSGTVNNSTNAGIRNLMIGWTTTVPENDYFLAVLSRTTSGGGNATFNQMLVSQGNSNYSGEYGVANSNSRQYKFGMGVYSATTSSLPGSIAFSQIYGTGSLVIRPPVLRFVSGSF